MTDIETTGYLGLTKLAEGQGFAANEYAFTGSNMDRLDAAARHVATHRHDGAPVAEDGSPEPPTLELAGTDGAIAGDTTVLYRVAKVNATGVESPASDPGTFDTPAGLVAPLPPTSTVTSGGELEGGIYGYAISAWRSMTTFETLTSNAHIANLPFTADDWQIILDLTEIGLDDDADGINIYRRSPGSTSWNFLTSIAAGDLGDTWTDDGSIDESATRLRPRRDFSNDANAITVTVDELGPGEKWRLYRTFTSSDIPGPVWTNTLIAELTTDDPYTDLGGPASVGTPLDTSFSLVNPPPVDLASEVTGVLAGANGGYGVTAVDAFIAVSAVDGTATTVTPIQLAPGKEADGIIPAGWEAASAPISTATLAGMIGADPASVLFCVPAGADAGVYRLTAANLATAWPAVYTPAVSSGLYLGIWSGTQYVQVPGTPAGFATVDLTGETPGELEVDLSTIEPWYDSVHILLPDGGDIALEITDLPTPWRGHLGVLATSADSPLRSVTVITPSGMRYAGHGGVSIDFAPYAQNMGVASPAQSRPSMTPGWHGPEAARGGTCTLSEGDLAVIPWSVDQIGSIDNLRASISGAQTGAAGNLYVLAPDPTNPSHPGPVIADTAIDLDTVAVVDAAIDAVTLVPGPTWFLGIHVVSATGPITIDAFDAAEHLPPLPGTDPSSTDRHSCLVAAAGTGTITTAAALSFTPSTQGPIIQAEVP